MSSPSHSESTLSSSFSSSASTSSLSHQDHSHNDILSILQPLSYTASQCGYCSQVKGMRSKARTGRSYGCWAHVLSCKTYAILLAQGWRRSGKYLYKPDMRATCCPQYTITLDTANYHPTKSQRSLLKKFTNFIKEGGKESNVGYGTIRKEEKDKGKGKEDSLLSKAVAVNFEPGVGKLVVDDDREVSSKKKEKKGKEREKVNPNGPKDLYEMVHDADWEEGKNFAHRFECTIERASFTEEKYELFRSYQTTIHGEPDAKVTQKGFKRFLVDTPLEYESTASPLHTYGSHHVLYRLDSALIALAVIDILPASISSVYFIWDPNYSALSLGKVSAIREISLVQELKADGVDMRDYMMGFYIHSCTKMRYKADYQPSSLLDPETNVFYPWEHCKPLLEKERYPSFSAPTTKGSKPIPIPIVGKGEKEATNEVRKLDGAAVGVERNGVEEEEKEDEEEEDDVAWPMEPPPGFLDPEDLPRDLLMETCVLEGRTLVPLMFSSAWHQQESKREIRECLAALGEKVRGRVVMWVN